MVIIIVYRSVSVIFFHPYDPLIDVNYLQYA